MNTRALLAALASAVAALLMSCSSGPTAGGGSDLPNGSVAAIVGMVVLPDSSPAVDAYVVLREVVITESGDSTVAEYQTTTDADGQYAIGPVEPGRYVLLVRSLDQSMAAIDQFVDVAGPTDTIARSPRLCSTVDLVGFVSLPPGYYYSKLRVSVPGTGSASLVDGNRMYVLEDVPQGYYDICFAYERIVNHMRVAVGDCLAADSTVQVRNVEFAVMGVMAQPGHEFHPTDMDTSFAVTPIRYAGGQEPPWYSTVDLSRVQYFAWDSGQTVTWVPSDPLGPPRYDMVVSGMVYRDATGRVTLETTESAHLDLTGPLVAWVGPQPTSVTVALIVRNDGQRVSYEVVDIYLRTYH